MKGKIIQLITPGAPVFAVFNIREGDGIKTPQTLQDLLLIPVPVLALVERPNGEQAVLGLEAHGNDEFDEPTGDNFLGYSHSEESAVEVFTVSPPVSPPQMSDEFLKEMRRKAEEGAGPRGV